MEIAVASAVTTTEVRESEATKLRQAISPAAPPNRFSIPRRIRINPVTNAGAAMAAAPTVAGPGAMSSGAGRCSNATA